MHRVEAALTGLCNEKNDIDFITFSNFLITNALTTELQTESKSVFQKLSLQAVILATTNTANDFVHL